MAQNVLKLFSVKSIFYRICRRSFVLHVPSALLPFVLLVVVLPLGFNFSTVDVVFVVLDAIR